MNENNITRFEVSNFKKFDHLVVENIGQVNLITGDNNVGKTTLLEALLFNEDNTRWIKYLHQTLYYRGIELNISNINTDQIKFPNENFLSYIFHDIHKRFRINYSTQKVNNIELSIEYKNIDNVTDEELSYRKDKYKIANVRDWVLFYKNGKLDELQWLYYDDMRVKLESVYWPYIGIDTPYSQDIRGFEQAITTNGSESNNVEFDYSDKKNIIKYLKILIDNIVDYDYLPFGKNKLHAIAKSEDGKYRPITTFGDGFQKYFRYVWSILYAKKLMDTRIMIDEIDAGTHYLKMKDEWKAIFELSKQTGIQIFATTHSNECIEAFAEAAEETEGWRDKIRLIELKEANVKGINKMYVNTFAIENIEAGIESSYDMRGGRIYGKY